MTATTTDPTGSEETKWETGLVRKVRASGRASGTKKKKTCGEVTRKCSLPPAPPTAGQPKAGGLTTCWGRRRGGSPRKAHESATTLKQSPPAGDLGRGAPAPTAPHPGAPEKGAVEELERSKQDAACARGAEPRAWDPNCRLRRHPRSLQAPGRAAPGLARARRSASKEPRRRAPRGGAKAPRAGPGPSPPASPPAAPSRLPLRSRRSGKRFQWSGSTPGTAPARTRVPRLTLPAPATRNSNPPHLRRLRQRWTQETPGSSTPALLEPPLRLTPLVSRQNGARGRALTSRPFPSPFPFLHSLPADGGMALAPANGRTPSARAAQSMPGTRGFKPITHYHSQKSRKKPGLLLATTNPDSYFAGLGQWPLASLEGPGPSPGACAPDASQ